MISYCSADSHCSAEVYPRQGWGDKPPRYYENSNWLKGGCFHPQQRMSKVRDDNVPNKRRKAEIVVRS